MLSVVIPAFRFKDVESSTTVLSNLVDLKESHV